jgi:ABC-type multidrug transport system ATPase subunit
VSAPAWDGSAPRTHAGAVGAPAIRVRAVTHAYGATRALDDVSLEIGAAELYGVIGPDGAGKTTLFRILATLLVPDRGEAEVLGCDVTRDLWVLRERIGYMPGRFALYPDLSVEENLRFFATVFDTTIAEGEGLIAPIWRQIAPFRDRRAGALSGGMKQKLALCCALVHRPDLLLLDEPTTGVDAVSRREFWDLLEALRGDGLTIVVSTPYMDEALRCDRVALLEGGRVLEVGAPAGFGARFAGAVLAVRTARAEHPSGAERLALLATLRAHPTAASAYPFGDEVHYTDTRPAAARDAVASEVRAAVAARFGGGAYDVAPIVPGIEDVFIARMRRGGPSPAAVAAPDGDGR